MVEYLLESPDPLRAEIERNVFSLVLELLGGRIWSTCGEGLAFPRRERPHNSQLLFSDS